jgi:hypothetical protein
VTYWDDVSFETERASLWVDNFDDRDGLNALNGGYGLFWEGPVEVISRTCILHGYGDVGAGLVLSYTVPPGSYAGWETDLRSVNLSDYDHLVFRMKGASGSERPNIYLMDRSGKRRLVRPGTYKELSTEWQTYWIPLEDFADVDLTSIAKLQAIVEWQEGVAKGTLFVDDIYFPAESGLFLPLILKGGSSSSSTPVRDVGPRDLSSLGPCNFEANTEGWTTHKVEPFDRAVIAVQRSTFRRFQGSASLALAVDLDGRDKPLRNRGVAYKNLDPPLDLACKPFGLWVYAPSSAVGDPEQPNYVRVFAQDVSGRYEYGAEMPVVRNQWSEVGLRPSVVAPPGGSRDPGFDPRAIARVGVEFGAGSSDIAYQGKIYLDACGWQEIDPPSATKTEACAPAGEEVRWPPGLPRQRSE